MPLSTLSRDFPVKSREFRRHYKVTGVGVSDIRTGSDKLICLASDKEAKGENQLQNSPTYEYGARSVEEDYREDRG